MDCNVRVFSVKGFLHVNSWRDWFKSANFAIYSCHFLASWSGRMWAFSMGLFLINISSTSLQLTAAYGLSMGACVLLFGAVIGDWVDKTPRLKAATLSMIVQNVLVVMCSGVVLTLLFLLSDYEGIEDWLRYLLYAFVVGLSVSSRLMKVARVIVVERDWIAEISAQDEHHLAVMTSSFRRIDLVTKIIAPIVTGQIMTYAGLKIGCGFIALWSLVSLGVEYYLIRRVYMIVPALRAVKSKVGFTGAELTLTVPIEEAVPFRVGDEHGENEKDRTGERNIAAPVSRKISCNWWRLCASFQAMYRGFRTYFSYDIMWAGLALAFLYLTVLGFDGITVGYATTQGLSGSVLGILMGVGATFGILATFTYPFIVRALGLSRTGVLALGLQVTCLTLCVVSVWMPGSPFDLFNSQETAIGNLTTPDCIKGAHKETLSQQTESSVSLTSNHSSCIDDLNTSRSQVNEYPSSKLSVWIMMAGIVTARFGLWTADLTIIQLFLERVVPTERGIVNGFQSSLNQLLDFFKYALVVSIPHPHQFGLLIIISYCFICTGWVFMGVYAFKISKRIRSEQDSPGASEKEAVDGLKEEDKTTVESSH